MTHGHRKFILGAGEPTIKIKKKDVMIITWKFDTVKTVEDRFSSAVKSGERVKWTIQFDSGRGQTIKSQDWYAKGAWGGASGRAVNGDSNVPNDFYGQGNWNSRDYWCNGLWVNGVYTKRDKIQVFVYVQVIGTRTTTTTTTTMTTLLSVLLKTFMLPEFSSWVIKDAGGKKNCVQRKRPSKLVLYHQSQLQIGRKKSYRVTCMNKRVGGWAGGYLLVKGKKLCIGYQWSQGNSWTEIFTAR